MQLTGAQILMEVLLEQGVDRVFGYPGGAVLNIYDALYEYRKKLKHYLFAHEQGACHAADGYARSTGRTGVVFATSGPGATNLVTGIATAYMDSVPLVAITGNVSTNLLGRDSFQEVFITGITMPITKHNYLVKDVNDLADTVREAFRIANTGRKGPVLIDIPKDITVNFGEYVPSTRVVVDNATKTNEYLLRQAAEKINEAKRPLLYVGGGVPASGAEKVLQHLMEKASIPAANTLMAVGCLPDDEKNLGLIGMHGKKSANLAAGAADVIVAVGTRFSDRVALNTSKFAQNAYKIQIDIDQSELNKNVKVDCRILGNAKSVLTQLLPFVNETSDRDWLQQIENWKKGDYLPKEDKSGALKPYRLFEILSETLPADTLFTTDVGQHQMWAAQYLSIRKTRQFLTSGGLGAMGYGYGAAIGAQLGNPDKRVVHITSDGSLHMNMNECCTAVSYGLPIVTVILNNEVLGMVRQWQNLFYQKHYSATDPHRKTDFVKVAEGFGAKGYRATTAEEFQTALASALQNAGPSWIDCRIGKDEKVLPMIPAGGICDDTIDEDF